MIEKIPISNLDDIEFKNIDTLINRYHKKILIYGYLFNFFSNLFLISPVLIFLIFKFDFITVLIITISSMLITKYLHLRTRTLFYICSSALNGFNQYKKYMIGLIH